MSTLNSFVCRILFIVAFALAALAILEKLLNFAGYTLIRAFLPGRLLELSAIVLLFVIALLLREVRHLLTAKAP